MADPAAPAPQQPSPRRRVVIAGAGRVGRAVASLLAGWDVSLLDSERCDLSSIPDTEVALAGAEVAVFAARAARPWGRLVQASHADLDLLLADTLAQAAPQTSVKRLVWFACGEKDAREPLLHASRLPLATLRSGDGPAQDPAAALAAMVEAPGAEARSCGGWSGGAHDHGPRPGAGDQVCSVQRYPLPRGWTAHDLGFAHFRWLAERSRLVRVDEWSGVFHLSSAGVRLLSLRHSPGRSRPGSCVFELAGGALARPVGRFEFRALGAGEGALAALVGYRPAWPWPLYRVSQALVHASTMARFGQWLAGQPAKG